MHVGRHRGTTDSIYRYFKPFPSAPNLFLRPGRPLFVTCVSLGNLVASHLQSSHPESSPAVVNAPRPPHHQRRACLIYPIALSPYPSALNRSLLEILPKYRRKSSSPHHFAIFCFFFGRSAISASAGPSLSPSASASAISSSLSLPELS